MWGFKKSLTKESFTDNFNESIARCCFELLTVMSALDLASAALLFYFSSGCLFHDHFGLATIWNYTWGKMLFQGVPWEWFCGGLCFERLCCLVFAVSVFRLQKKTLCVPVWHSLCIWRPPGETPFNFSFLVELRHTYLLMFDTSKCTFFVLKFEIMSQEHFAFFSFCWPQLAMILSNALDCWRLVGLIFQSCFCSRKKLSTTCTRTVIPAEEKKTAETAEQGTISKAKNYERVAYPPEHIACIMRKISKYGDVK